MKRSIILLFTIYLFNYNVVAQNVEGTKILCAPVVKTKTSEIMQHWINYYPAELKKRNYQLGLQ